jgi:TRAP-type mannitol/chloroaromatic compound transport system substrate-binding protein
MLAYYLNSILNFNYDSIKKLGFKTYKDEKEIMSSQIPVNLYKSCLEKDKDILKLHSSSEDQIKQIKKRIRSYNSSDDSNLKILVNNLLMSR